MALTLSPEETRILGCLIEKERTTPEQYPLSLNSVTTACNQSTNRDPVTYYEEQVVALGLDDLRGKKLVTQLWGAGSRVQKFRHNLLDAYELNPREVAVLCVLLLRGPQTLGELRVRTERMHAFANIGEVEECLRTLGEGADPLVRVLPPRPGQKEKRFVQLLSGEPALEETTSPEPRPAAASAPSRVVSLEAEVAALKAEVAALREEFARFRKQFE
ncbi:MAG: YceH family protein [Verrucomicrobia bacterium]|nr:YceH family protein [Verrucomicrobiota bacterium]